MTACSGDPGAKQLEAVNDLLRKASQLISQTTTPGFLEIWDGSAGNLLRQYAVPTVDALAPTPVFTYNSLNVLSGSPNAFGSGWLMHFMQSVNGSTSAGSTAVVNKGTGTSFRRAARKQLPPATGKNNVVVVQSRSSCLPCFGFVQLSKVKNAAHAAF